MHKIKTAIVIGGTSGLGRSIAGALADAGVQVTAFGRHLPEEAHANICWQRMNLLSDDLSALAAHMDADAVVFAAGLGRIAPFEQLTDMEITTAFRTNAESFARVLHMFQPRLAGEKDLYFAVIGSIAGLVSSPMFAAYGAAKAAVKSLCESVNAELAAQGCMNRILNVAPGALKGTRFYGGKDQPELTRTLAEEIIRRMLSRETLFIPNYEETYRGVLERYHADPEKFGIESWQYKQQSGRIGEKPRGTIGFLSGTFDLFHIGHLNLLRRAKQYCDYLIVGVHPPGSSHKNKPTFIPLEERMAILESIKYVDKVVVTLDEDDAMYELYPYDYLFVGSDYKGTERFNRYEEKLCPLGVQIIYFPYTQGTSSTQLREALTIGRADGHLPGGA